MGVEVLYDIMIGRILDILVDLEKEISSRGGSAVRINGGPWLHLALASDWRRPMIS